MAEEILDPHGDAPTFVIGLAMAGAVSAGAYTAGVLDTLFLALDAHQRRFEAGEVGYRVVLKAMSGSSAGGICAALGSMALIDGVRPIRPDEAAPTRPESAADLGHAPRHVGLPVLYDLWVRRINLLGKRSDDPARRDPEIDGLLSLSDLGPKGSNVHSVLDSTFIDAQAQALLRDCIVPDPSKIAGFVASDLEIFLTTTNLMGIPYEVRFSGEDSPGHLMASHGAVTHFSLHGVGSAQVSSEWLDIWDDPGTPVDVTAFDGRAVDFSGETASDTVWKSLLDTAVASGAFPVGLASRQLVMEPVDLHQRAWPVDANPDIRPVVRLSGRIELSHSLPYVAVDGGVANNEPFELARFALRPSLKKTRQAAADREKDPEAARLLRDRANETPDWQLAPNPRAANEADRAVIMIDPFPEGPELAAAETEDSPQRSIEASVLFAAKRLLPSLINQARFKPTELMNATDDSIHSRFLVAPSRTLTSKREIIEVLVKEDVSVEAQPERLPEKLKMSGAAAIASGFLGGFGGFFSEFFREHDYRLGQKNCRSFLENYFVLAPDNPLFEGSEDLRRPMRGGVGRSGMVRILQFDGGELPDMTRRFTDPHQLPALKDAVLSDTVKHIRRRIERAGLRLVEGAEMGWFPKLLIDQAWNGVGWPKWKWRATNGLRESVAQRMERTLLADLTARRQSERSEGMTDAQRALYVGLLRQHGKRASAEAIAEASTIIPSLDVAAMSALAPGESRNAKAFRLRSKLEVLRQMRANDELTGKTHLRIRKKTPPGGDSPSEYVLAE